MYLVKIKGCVFVCIKLNKKCYEKCGVEVCEVAYKYTLRCIHYPAAKVLAFLWLSPQGMALVFAPLRGETLALFCQLAQQAGLYVSQHQQYDAQVMDVHLKVRSLSKKRKTSCKVHGSKALHPSKVREMTA